MLADITIDNLGVIPHATATFSPGLTVLTGETGAGKTMIVTGLKMICGHRSDPSRVRSGADAAVVEGRFSFSGMDDRAATAARQVAADAGAEADENGDYVAVRKIFAQGRSRAHLSGRSVPAATLAGFTAPFLSIHGQMDQMRMLDPAEQLAVVDASDPRIAPLADKVARSWREWKQLADKLKELTGRSRHTAQEIDRLKFAIDEIDRVAPQPDEDSELKNTIRRMQDVDDLREAATRALALIDGAPGQDYYGDNEPAADQLGAAQQQLLSTSDSVLTGLGQQLADITSQLGDISRELGGFIDGLDADPAGLEELLGRQAQIKQLTRKYAADINGVLAWREKAGKKLATLDISPEKIDRLSAQTREAKKQLDADAEELTTHRCAAAARLAAAVTGELSGLAMGGSRLEIAVTDTPVGSSGKDQVEFLLGAAPGEPARPLSQAASGGELSRVMLALEVNLAGAGGSRTFIFDEVDSGVGGRAAVEIGKRLASLARTNQVIVVTHLPQVAAFADQHLHVSKSITDGKRAASGIAVLEGDTRVAELARMLAGLDDTDTGRAHAAELLAAAAGYRDSLA
ncbi:DNA repair protein RecN [Corynebacterium mendelii]|uniref:DNA repair protein RecN n=1 Tax=Corynebacterium mendelii TaxID=2765362 RepID=A0A939DZA4_9CORY|nr:DNA repair protein RecN [Corynebacterium mendelii]MBN9643586.1 DNA repair protein RecN [Corynebacterium mendelii]